MKWNQEETNQSDRKFSDRSEKFQDEDNFQ